MNEILIFSTHTTNRLLFVLDFIFKDFTNLNWRTTNDAQIFATFAGPKINYSNTQLSVNEIQIIPTGLIEESGLNQIVANVKWIDEMPVLFPVNKTENLKGWPFDLFSAIFFMLSRFEEYNHPAKDQYGRFPAKESLAFKHGFLHLPVVDIWLVQLMEAIATNHTSVHFQPKKMQVNFTYDLDVAYTYKGRGMFRQLGAIGKDFIGLRFAKLFNRLSVLAGFANDPSDTYDYIEETSINPIFFFLLAEKLSKYDRNISPKSKAFQKLVGKLKDRFPIGIHPSFYSSVQPEKLVSEKGILEKISGMPITISRQHYLKFEIPATFKALIKAGITEDYSMGFAEIPGFRAGTCTPFYFFDLEKNETSELKMFPCCIMETIFRDDLIMPAKEALPYFIQYYEAVKKVNGHFISIWHNDSFKIYIKTNDAENFRWLHDEILRYIRKFT